MKRNPGRHRGASASGGPAAHLMAALEKSVQCFNAGRFAEARRILADANRKAPNHPDVLHLFGLAEAETGEPAKGAVLIERALSLQPGNPNFLKNLGQIHRRAGAPDKAAVCFEEVLTAQPNDPEALNNLGNARSDLGDRDEAVACFRRALALAPDYLPARYNLGTALAEGEDFDDAEACFRDVLKAEPNHRDALNNLGELLSRRGRFAEAADYFERTLAVDPGFAAAALNVGNAQVEAGDLDGAVASYQRVLQIDPGIEGAHFGIGGARTISGDLEAAANAFAREIEAHPEAVRAYERLAGLKKLTPDDAVTGKMIDLCASPGIVAGNKAPLHFALHKVFDGAGDVEKAFDHLAKANAVMQRDNSFDFDETRDQFARIKAVFTKDRLAAPIDEASASDLPVFVLGMPRSGTTLVEQIIAAHPEAHGAGELGHLLAVIESIGDYPEAVPSMTPKQLATVGDAYIAALRTHAPGAARVTDKMPANFRHIGLIHLALPDAAVIHCRRHPMATGFSCYQQSFRIDGRSTQPYSHDLADLGGYYRLYADLMDHWRNALPPGRLLEIDYEEVIANLGGSARRIIVHCGLPWDDRSLRFHESGNQVRTLSAAQVRRPIYTEAREKWRRYEEYLGPLREALGDLVE